MKFWLALFITAAMALVLSAGVVQAAHGHPGLLLAGVAAFISAIGFWGCRAH